MPKAPDMLTIETKRSSPPAVKDILTVMTKRKATFNRLRQDSAQAIDTYELNDRIGIAPPYSVLRSPRARNLIDVPGDHIIADKPVVTVKPRNVSEKYQREADLHEKAMQGVALTYLKPLLRKQTKRIVAYGHAWWKTLVDPARLERLADEPDARDKDAHLLWEVNNFDNFPIIIQIPVPTTIYHHGHETSPGRPYDVFEIYEREVFEVEEKWPGAVKGFSQAHYGENIEWAEWWHQDWRCFFAGGDDVFGVQPNAYGFVPYRHADAGYGIDTEKFEPHVQIKSILFPVYDMIKFESRTISQLDTILTKFAHPTPVKTGQWDSSGIDYSPGHEIELPEGKFWKKDFEIIPGVEPPQSIYATLNLIDGFFEQVQPGVVRGQAIGASAPAYANEAMIGQGRLKYGGPLMALKESSAGVLSDVLRLAELVVKKPISVHATGTTGNFIQTIKPDEINGYYECEVDLEAKDPSLSNQKKQLGLQMYTAGTIPLRMLLEDYYSISNATEIEAELAVDKIILTDPVLRSAYVAEALEVLGREKELAMIQQEQAKQQGMDEFQAKKEEQFGGNETLTAQNNMMEGNLPNGQEMQGQGIPRLEMPGGATPLPMRNTNA